MQNASNIRFPRGVKLVKTYYKNQEWCYFPDPDTFISDYNAGKAVRLGMRSSRGRMKIATFCKQVETEGNWEDDRGPTGEEAEAILIAIGRMVPRPHRSKTPAHRSDASTQPRPKPPKPEDVRAGFEAGIGQDYVGSGVRPQFVWFDSEKESASKVKAGRSLLVGVKIHHGSLSIYKVGLKGCRGPRKASDGERNHVLRELGYKN